MNPERVSMPDFDSVRTKITSRGKMAFVQIDDGTAILEVSVFNEIFENERAKIRVVADRLLTLAEARGRFARYLSLSVNGEASGQPSAARRLRDLLAPCMPGNWFKLTRVRCWGTPEQWKRRDCRKFSRACP